jgi:hypothetical protein
MTYQRAKVIAVEREQDRASIGSYVWVQGPPELCNDPYCIWCATNGRQWVYRGMDGVRYAARMLELQSEFKEQR